MTATMTATLTTTMSTPIGMITLTGRPGVLTGLFLERPAGASLWRRDDAAFAGVTGQLERYFDGTLREFDVELGLEGTEFQRTVWNELRRIPYGETISYGELAARIGRPTASRAVGLANGRNPVSIIVPCHRVVGADGSLTGYAYGLDCKRYLLDLELKNR